MKMLSLLRRFVFRKKSMKPRRPPYYQLGFEQLENRLVPSTITFTQLNFSTFDTQQQQRTLNLSENDYPAVVVQVSRDTTGTEESVDFTTQDGTAVGWDGDDPPPERSQQMNESETTGDYIITTGTITFGTSESTISFTVPITNQAQDAGFKYFFVHHILFDIVAQVGRGRHHFCFVARVQHGYCRGVEDRMALIVMV